MRVASWLRRRFGQGARPTSRYEREGGNKRKSGAWGGKQDVELVAQALTNHSAARPPEEAQGRGTGVEGIVRLRGSSAAAEHKQHKQPGVKKGPWEHGEVGSAVAGACRVNSVRQDLGTARLPRGGKSICKQDGPSKTAASLTDGDPIAFTRRTTHAHPPSLSSRALSRSCRVGLVDLRWIRSCQPASCGGSAASWGGGVISVVVRARRECVFFRKREEVPLSSAGVSRQQYTSAWPMLSGLQRVRVHRCG